MKFLWIHLKDLSNTVSKHVKVLDGNHFESNKLTHLTKMMIKVGVKQSQIKTYQVTLFSRNWPFSKALPVLILPPQNLVAKVTLRRKNELFPFLMDRLHSIYFPAFDIWKIFSNQLLLKQGTKCYQIRFVFQITPVLTPNNVEYIEIRAFLKVFFYTWDLLSNEFMNYFRKIHLLYSNSSIPGFRFESI